GRIAPLDAYRDLLVRFDGRILVDESHGFGIVGPGGRGAAARLGASQVSTVAATLSKAFCAHGALLGCAAGDEQHIRSTEVYRASSSGATFSAAAATAALAYVTTHPEMRDHILSLAKGLRHEVAS